MIRKLIILSLLSASIQNVLSYTTYGFYQGPNKANPPLQSSQPQLQSQPAVQPRVEKYTASGFYQGINNVAPQQPPQQLPPQEEPIVDKYQYSGFYQGDKKVAPQQPVYQPPQPRVIKYMPSGFYEGPNKVDHIPYTQPEQQLGHVLLDDERYMLKQVERLFEDDVTIKLLMKLIKKIALL